MGYTDVISPKTWIKSIMQSNWVAFAFMALISAYFTGYHFAADNVNLLIPVRQAQDPSFLANDITFSSVNVVGRIFLVKAISGLAFFVPIGAVFFILFLLTRVLLCAGIFGLAYTLTRDKALSFLSIAAVFYLYAQRIPLASSHLVHPSFYPSYLAFSISLLAIALFIEGKYLLSLILLAVITNIHFVTGTQAFGILLTYGIVFWRQMDLKQLSYGLIAYMLLASPELFNALMVRGSNSFQGDFSVKDYIEIVGYMRTPHHFIPTTWPAVEYLRFGVFAVSGAYSYVNSKTDYGISSGIKICLITAGLLIVSTPLIYHSTAIMLYCPFRMARYIFLIMLVYTVMFLLNSLRERTKGLKVWSIVCLVFLNSPYILSLLFLGRILYDLLGRYTKSRAFFLIVNLAISGSMTFSPSRFGVYEIRGRDLMFIFLLIGTIAATRLIVRGDFRLTRNINSIVVIFISFLIVTTVGGLTGDGKIRLIRKLQPEFRIEESADFVDLCSWIKANSREGDIIIVPPLMKNMRYFSERPILANYKFYPIEPMKVKEWYERLDLLSKRMLSKNRKEIVDRRAYLDRPRPTRLLKAGYLKLNGDDFKAIGKKYGCSLVVTRFGHEVSLERVYENSKYNVYELDLFRRTT
jgi:hypothetical protein